MNGALGARGLRRARWVGGVLTLAALASLARHTAHDLRLLPAAGWTLRPGPLAASLLLQVLVLAGGVGLWRRTDRHAGGSPPAYAALLRLWWRTSVARYLPGKVWPFVVAGLGAARPDQASAGRSPGASSPRTLAASLALHALAALAGAALVGAAGGVGVLVAGRGSAAAAGAGALVAAALAAGGALMVALLPPTLVSRALRALGRALGHPLDWRAARSEALALLAGHAAAWVVQGVAVHLLAAAVLARPLPAAALPATIAATALAFAAGTALAVAPAGLGVREATFAALLAVLAGPHLAPGTALGLTVAVRLWATAAELLLGAAALATWRPARRAPAALDAAPAVPTTDRAPPRVPARRDFTVIIPAFDEADNVAPLFDALAAAFARHGLAGQVVFVDDGSSDGTRERAVRAAAAFPGDACVVAHARNRGKTEAIATGAAAARGAHLVLLDADLQYAPDDIPRFLDALDRGWDVVAARKQGPYAKARVSRVYNRLSRWLFRVAVRDCNSMKAMRREVLAAVPARHNWHRYLVAIAAAQGRAITELDVRLHPRHAGAPKYDGAARVVGATRDLVAVWLYVRARRHRTGPWRGGADWAAAGGLRLGTPGP